MSPSDGVGKRLSAGKGFHGQLENINVDKLNKGIGHLNIEKQASLPQARRARGGALPLYGVRPSQQRRLCNRSAAAPSRG